MNTFQYGSPILKLENLSLSFNNKVILRGINFEVMDIIGSTPIGQVITLLGRSGVGKTQLMRMIAGLQKPSSGNIKIGLALQAPEVGKVGMVLQSYPLFEHRTVIKNLKLVCKEDNKVIDLAREFNVDDCLLKYPCQLSGGQRQRVAIIQQILSSERFILLDEPFSGLDPVATNKLSLNIRKIADNHSENTIIISSHILEPAMAVSDTVVMLGKQEGTEGATVVKYYDLIAMGLAWRPEIRRDPNFVALCANIREEFNNY